MHIAPPRVDEDQTLAALQSLDILDSAPEALFDALVQAASLICQVPISLVSLVDEGRQWFKANLGLPGVTETPRDAAFCAHAVLGEALLEVQDARQDPRFHDNPLVTGQPDIRFYAGMPLCLPGGEVVGTLCVIDRIPRQLTPEQREALACLAAAAVQALVQRKSALGFAASEARYRALVEDQTELISMASPEGQLEFVNSAYARAMGKTPETLIGTSLFDLVAEPQRGEVRAHWDRVCRASTVVTGENQMVMGNGEVRWLAWSNRPLRDEHGQVTGVHSVGRDCTERRQSDERLAAKRQRITNILDGTQAGTWEWNVHTGEARFNDRWAAIVGYSLDELVPTSLATWLALIHPDDLATWRQSLDKHFAGATSVHDCDVRMRHKLGHWVWVHTRGSVLSWSATGQPEWMFGTQMDVTEQRRLTEELAEQHELLRVTLQSIGDAVITTDGQARVTWLNPAAERMTGWVAQEALGHPLNQVFHIVNEETRAVAENPVATCLAREEIVGLVNHTVLISRDGTEYGIEDSAAPIRNSQGEILGVVLVFHDVSEQRRLSGEMTYRATHDALTGLVNRTEFEARMLRVLRKAHEEQSEHALLYIDLDQFKLVNDACGHAIGDQLLQQVSRLLSDAVRTRDTLARLGGDEFAIILEHCTTEQAQRVAQKICDRMDEFRFIHEDRRFRIGASIGMVPVDRRWASTAAIQQAADTSCYAAKEAGRNRVHVWFDTDAAMRARHVEMQWTSRIERALDDEGFVLHAQRIDPLQQQVPGIHAEVLLRMKNDDGSLALPGAFLPAAERFNLVSRVDRWVLRRVVLWLATLPDLDQIATLSVNLSGQSVGDRAFHAWAHELLAEAGPSLCTKLCLEITETAAVTHLADAALFIEKVRGLGVKVALDDFGAGASSFGYLRSLPVDFLKIDGQFIRDLDRDPLNDAAVRCFADVAKVVGVKTVAEFVERPEIRDRLVKVGIDFAQGYLIHRPESLNALRASVVAAVD